MTAPDWSAIERDIECALVGEKVEHDLMLTTAVYEIVAFRGRLAVEWDEVAHADDETADAFRRFTDAWRSGPTWN